MTKPEQQKTKKFNVQGILHDALVEAHSKGRVTCGLYETAEAFESNPNLYGICILPKDALKDPDDGGLLFMMETFCRENSIPVVKASNLKKLAEDAGLKSSHEDDGEALNCILIMTCPYDLSRRSRHGKKVSKLSKMCTACAKKGKQVIAEIE